MKRRTVLAGLGTAFLTGGCLATDRAGSPTEAGGRDTQGDGSPADDAAPSTTPGTKSGTPDDPSTDSTDPFADLGCPSMREADVTVCAHADDHPIPITLRPEATTFRVVQGDDGVETLRLTLSNASGRPFGFNPHDWRVDRHTAEGWTKVAPQEAVEPWTEVPPDGYYEYELASSHHPSPSDSPHQIVPDLTSGVHAVSVVGNWGEGADAERVECVALVDITVEAEDSWPTTTTVAAE